MSISHFSIREIRRLKDRAEAAAELDLAPSDRAAILDPSGVVQVFESLSVRPGWRLEAHFHGGGLGAESRVVALPPTDDPVAFDVAMAGGMYLPGEIREGIDTPVGATDRFMLAIDGDDSDWSYLCASLLVRQLTDFGAFWHALYEHDWFEHTILAAWPPPAAHPGQHLDVAARNLTDEERTYFEEAHGVLIDPDDPWTARLRWLGSQPAQWRPWVGRIDGVVVVEMYTYRPPTAVEEAVWLHRDTYTAGSYEPAVSDRLLASGLPPTLCY